MTRVLSVVNYKGGAGKSTTTAFLLHALAARDDVGGVAGVDADPGASLVEWAALAEWSIPVVGLAVPTLHRRLWGVIDRDRVDVVGIDTPPLEEKAGIVQSAMLVATDIVVTMAPTTMEVHRTTPIWPAIDGVCSLRDDNPPNVWVLLNRTVANASSTDVVREQLTGEGHRVFEQAVPRLERYGQSFGGSAEEVDGGPYAVVADEIVRTWQRR